LIEERKEKGEYGEAVEKQRSRAESREQRIEKQKQTSQGRGEDGEWGLPRCPPSPVIVSLVFCYFDSSTLLLFLFCFHLFPLPFVLAVYF
jgi:hypothetical protein